MAEGCPTCFCSPCPGFKSKWCCQSLELTFPGFYRSLHKCVPFGFTWRYPTGVMFVLVRASEKKWDNSFPAPQSEWGSGHIAPSSGPGTPLAALSMPLSSSTLTLLGHKPVPILTRVTGLCFHLPVWITCLHLRLRIRQATQQPLPVRPFPACPAPILCSSFLILSDKA